MSHHRTEDELSLCDFKADWILIDQLKSVPNVPGAEQPRIFLDIHLGLPATSRVHRPSYRHVRDHYASCGQFTWLIGVRCEAEGSAGESRIIVAVQATSVGL